MPYTKPRKLETSHQKKKKIVKVKLLGQCSTKPNGDLEII